MSILKEIVMNRRENKYVEHIDQDPLNYRRSNLRIVTQKVVTKKEPVSPTKKYNAIEIRDGYAVIKIKKGEAIIDIEDVNKVENMYWRIYKNGLVAHPGSKTYLHRLIAGATKNLNVSFKDKNKLNCRKINLEVFPKSGGKNTIEIYGNKAIMTAYIKKTIPVQIFLDVIDVPLVKTYR